MLLLAVCPAAGCQARPQETVKVFCWSLTPQAKAVISGLERGLGRSLPVVEAGGDYDRGELLVRELAHEKLQLLVVLGTQALMLTAPRIKKTPVVFALVADPYHTGAAYNKAHPEDHQANITGVASPPPLEEALRQGRKLFPAKRRWGLLYNPGEGSSLELQQHMAALAQQSGLELTARPAATESEAMAQLTALPSQGVEVVYIPPEQFSRQYAASLLQLGKERRLVVINGNPRIDGKGAVLTVTLDYDAVGEEAARLAQRLLAGEKPAKIPIVTASPAQVQVDEALLSQWAGYPPGR